MIATMVKATVCAFIFLGVGTAWGAASPPASVPCGRPLAHRLGTDVLLPEAQARYEKYYDGIADDYWFLGTWRCVDLTGDGTREIVVSLECCTASSLDPFAIFRRQHGYWQISYIQVHDDVARLWVKNRALRAARPAPYNGACTSWFRDRRVRWTHGRFVSVIGHRYHVARPGCP